MTERAETLLEVARWMRDALGYPFDFVTSVRPPEALIEALVAVWAEDDRTSAEDWRWAILAEIDQPDEAETPLGEDIDSSGHTDDL